MNLSKSDIMMTVAGSSIDFTNPNASTDKPININPNPSRFGWPKHSIILPTYGENMMSATENDANTNPTNSGLMFFSSNMIGRNGAASA